MRRGADVDAPTLAVQDVSILKLHLFVLCQGSTPLMVAAAVQSLETVQLVFVLTFNQDHLPRLFSPRSNYFYDWAPKLISATTTA